MKKVELELVVEGRELYLKAHGRIQKVKRDAEAATRKKIETIICDEEAEVCFDDIDESVTDHGAKSEEAFELLYELVEDSEVAVSLKSKKCQWKHKVTGDKMYQYTQQTNREKWDTGILNKFLKDTHKRHKDSKTREYIHAALRADYLLAYQMRSKPTLQPKDGMSLYTWEEDLPTHVLECLAIVDTGVPTSFFSNPYVKKLLQKLNDQHRPIYWLKTMRMIWCICDVLSEDIYIFMMEGFLAYSQSFVSSTSNFWWDPVRKKSFGASIANFMATRYEFRDSRCLFISNATRKTMDTSELAYMKGVLDRCQALLDFKHFTKPHTGEHIGAWLKYIHHSVGCKPPFIGGHTVDGASNAGSSVEHLEWLTEDGRPQKILAKCCDAHKINTEATKGSGTSTHVYNLNPDCGKSLTKLHVSLVQTKSSGTRTVVYDDVQKEHGREKTKTLDFLVIT